LAPVSIFGVYVSNVQVRCLASYAVGSMGWRGPHRLNALGELINSAIN